jgi:hypothetical protein
MLTILLNWLRGPHWVSSLSFAYAWIAFGEYWTHRIPQHRDVRQDFERCIRRVRRSWRLAWAAAPLRVVARWIKQFADDHEKHHANYRRFINYTPDARERCHGLFVPILVELIAVLIPAIPAFLLGDRTTPVCLAGLGVAHRYLFNEVHRAEHGHDSWVTKIWPFSMLYVHAWLPQHLNHHAKKTTNFAICFLLWDWVLGTQLRRMPTPVIWGRVAFLFEWTKLVNRIAPLMTRKDVERVCLAKFRTREGGKRNYIPFGSHVKPPNLDLPERPHCKVPWL